MNQQTVSINTTFTTDGQQGVWAVFDNDGCECSDFEGVFDSQENAEAVAESIRKFHQSRPYPWRGSVEVEFVSLNYRRSDWKKGAADAD